MCNGGSFELADSFTAVVRSDVLPIINLSNSRRALNVTHSAVSTFGDCVSSPNRSSEARMWHKGKNHFSRANILSLLSFNKTLSLQFVALPIHHQCPILFALPSIKCLHSHSQRALWFSPRENWLSLFQAGFASFPSKSDCASSLFQIYIITDCTDHCMPGT